MVSVVEQELGLVDPKSVAYWQDTIGTVAALRERWPVVRSTAGDFEVLRALAPAPFVRPRPQRS